MLRHMVVIDVHGMDMRRISILAFAAVLASCSATGNREGVSVVHLADKFGAAMWAADKHCAEFGLSAVHVKTSSARGNPDALYLQTRTSDFNCVEN